MVEKRNRGGALEGADSTKPGASPCAPDDSARRMFATVGVLVALAIVALNLHAPAEPTPLQRLLASLLIALCAVPSLMWAARRPWRHSVMPYVGVLYAACFSAAVFVRIDFHGSWTSAPLLEAEAIDYALMLALAGWGALLAGYFAIAGRKPRFMLPTVRVLPSNDPRLAKTVAVVVGLAAAPFFYLDKALVAGGKALLPAAAAFPVTLAGQFVVFAALVCFHLHLRGQLGIAGRLYFAALVAYYTILGFSTGMLNHGITAVFALFVAYAVGSPRPTWRGIACGVAAAAVLVFVLIPARLEYRQLIWEHDPNIVLPISNHQFALADGDEQALTTPAYDATLRGRTLTLAHSDAEVCRGQTGLTIGVIVDPVDPNDLPDRTRHLGFQGMGIPFEDGAVEDGRCVVSVLLPEYRKVAVRIRLYRLIRVAQHDPGAPGPHMHRSLAEKTAVFAKTMAMAFDGEGGVQRAADVTPNRFDYLLPLAWLTTRTPDRMPFLYGETYLPILYKLIPRIVFADKPTDVRDLGVLYGFTPGAKERPAALRPTSYKMHQLGEFYVNFGLAGVLLGMFVLGFLYRSLHELFHQPGSCTATLAAGTHMLAVLALEMESILSVSLGFLIWYAIALVALALVVRVGRWLRR